MSNSFTGIGGWNAVDSEMRTASAGLATTTALNELAQAVANFGSYTTANGTGADNHPDVQSPSTKTIYLVKDSSITSGDAYKEWICTNTSTPTYELIGDTQVDLSNYATTAVFAGSTPGLVPSASANDATKALRGDGSWGDVSNVSVTYTSATGELHLDFSNGGN